jgi:ribonuclease Z
MPTPFLASEIRLVNGSTGDPLLFVDYPGRDDALMFDSGENGALDPGRLGDLGAVFVTHHHIDHFVGLDRVVRANLDRDKTLRIFGPEGTIRKVHSRVTSYEHPFFPFQKLVIEVHELLDGRRLVARMECARRFPEPEVSASAWDGKVALEEPGLAVEAARVDHTVPCLAYAVVERAGPQPDPGRLATGPLRPGPWVGQALGLLRANAPDDTPLAVGGGQFPLGWLREQYFRETKETRLTYVTDTAWSAASRPALLRLARKARRLYCDAFYSQEHAKQAEKYRHMTARQAAEFAQEAEVGELVLIHFSARYEGRYEPLIAEARAVFPNTTAVLDCPSST